MGREADFLTDLAGVLDKHGVAICSRVLGDYAEVIFEFIDRREGSRHKRMKLHTGRLHFSAHDANIYSKEENLENRYE